jgi:uncharacterized SAM-binding protein YcdF (DUF218 family)
MDSVFFVLSKLTWGVLSPSNLIIIMMTLATTMLLNNKVRAAKWILFPLTIMTFLLMAYPFSDSLISPLENRFSKPDRLPQKIDGIILLGGGEKLKQSLSWHSHELGAAGDRYIAAALLAKHYPEVPIIYSGGSGLLRFQTDKNEASIAQVILTTIGIAKQRLIIESQSRNTYENFLFLKQKLPKATGQYLLVTSAFHMPRAIGTARKQGINVIAYPVDYRSNNIALRQWDFDLFEHLKALEPASREWIGLTAYYWMGKTSAWLPKDLSE